MFHIFNKRESADKGTRRDLGHPAHPAVPVNKARNSADSTFQQDIPVDAAMRSLDSRLSSFAHIEVSQAAKERGWATLRREVQRHPVRPAAPALLKGTGAKSGASPAGAQPVVTGGHSRAWRLGLSSAGVAVVVVAVLIGSYAAGLLGNGHVGGVVATTTPTFASVQTTTTVETTPSTQQTATSTVTTGTNTTSSTTGTVSTSVTTDVEPTTQATTPDTGTPTTGGDTTSTTAKPVSTTTSNPVMSASAQRVNKAKDAVVQLGDAILAKFNSGGDIETARSLVASPARSSLTQLISSLTAPSSAQIVPNSTKSISSETVRLTLEFLDSNRALRFYITVHVDDQSATITAISAGS